MAIIEQTSNIKYLIKQNDEFYSINPEYYNNGQFQPLILENITILNKNDFINNGFENVNELFITKNNAMINGIKSELNNGNIFSFEIREDFENIIHIE